MLVVGHRKRGVSPEVRIACGGLDLWCLLFQEGDYSGGRLPVVAHFPVHEKFLIYSIDPVSVRIEVIVGVLEVDLAISTKPMVSPIPKEIIFITLCCPLLKRERIAIPMFFILLLYYFLVR